MQPQLRNAGALTFCLEYSRGAPNNVDTHGEPLPAVSVVWNGPARIQLVPKHSFTLTRQKTVKARVALGQAASFRPENTHTPGANERRLQAVEEACDANEEARPGCTAGSHSPASGHLAITAPTHEVNERRAHEPVPHREKKGPACGLLENLSERGRLPGQALNDVHRQPDWLEFAVGTSSALLGSD